MNYLGYNSEELATHGAMHTAKEICQQPELWKNIWQSIVAQREQLETFIDEAKKADRIIMTGAGTSAFIGESLVGSFNRNLHNNTQAIPTTHLVSHPHDYISDKETLLLISFARSGNSPESKAAVELADRLSKKCFHLIITCNEEGDLANYKSESIKYIIMLPKEANDKSLAMTSSYTGMLLSGLLVSQLERLDQLETQVTLACKYATRILEDYIDLLKKIAQMPFKRAVFLGSGPLYGTATESHLKLQELTDGNIICKHDSFLGFRHGPKAVVNSDTLVVYLLSNSHYVSQYEDDLVVAMERGEKALVQIAVSEYLRPELPADHHITYSSNGLYLQEDFLTLPSIIPGQVLSFYKSINEGLSPDRPSTTGAISRVVEGVNIYNLQNQNNEQ